MAKTGRACYGFGLARCRSRSRKSTVCKLILPSISGFRQKREQPERVAAIKTTLLLVAHPHHIGIIMTLDETNQIIVNAFKNNKFGISPTSTRGAVQNYSKKHGLDGVAYTEALAAAIANGLVAPMADSALTIRNAGRAMLPAR
jgi:hypothetical protein